MGLLDDAENLASKNPDEVKSITDDAEQFADKETGGKFDSQIDAAGSKLDDQLDSGQSDQSGR
ncbi:MAG TPA: antitoxin [Streptosporangiaceae bacterium]|nr:antitoxin [Streptosporangiaceae bacterium]